MAYFRIKQQDHPTKYIKSMDGANGTLEFTENLKEAMYRDMGFFADSDFEFIKFHFTKEYPELENMDIYDGYSDEDKCEEAVEAAVDEWDAAPAAPAYNGFNYDVGVNVGVADVAP